MLAGLERMFAQKAAGGTEMPPKLGVHFDDDAFIHAMPASVHAMDAAGMKWVSAYPANRDRGVPQVNGLMIMNDPETGVPYAVLDGVAITAARTAAVSALSARYLAREDSETLGILGCGVQGRSHVRAFANEFGLESIVAFDVSREALEEFADEIRAEYGVEVVEAATPRDAVSACDLIVTAGPITNPPHATIGEDWLSTGAFAVSIDYGSYWHRGALDQMDVLCTDDVAQYASHQANGQLQGLPSIELELADLVSEGTPVVRDLDARTFACNLGIALADVVVARKIAMRALREDVGLRIPR